MSGSRRGFLGLALLSPLWGCPPNLSGEQCDDDCTCPSSETCVFSDGGSAGTCQNGTNQCGTGSPQDAGPDAGDAGPPDGGETLEFLGTVVLNGGAFPIDAARVYGYADGDPVNAGGTYTGADLTDLADGGGFAFFAPVPETDAGYRFVAVYDCNGGHDFDVNDTGVFYEQSVAGLVPQSPAALSVRLDVQTSTCYSVTVDIPQLAETGAATTYLFGVGAVAYDIRTGGPLTEASDFDSAFATFDAGSSLPPGFSPLGQMTLTPVGTIPDSPVDNSWVYVASGGTALSTVGSFFFSLTDLSNAKPQYPAGTCEVSYAPPPGFPFDLAINGMNGGDGGTVLWGTALSGQGTTDMVSWSDFDGGVPLGFTRVGDFIAIVDGSGTKIYPSVGQSEAVNSPQSIPDVTVPARTCDVDNVKKAYCYFEVTSVYLDARKGRSTPYEGGTIILPFQRQIATTP